MIPIVAPLAATAAATVGKQVAKKVALKFATTVVGTVTGKVISNKMIKKNRAKGGKMKSSDTLPTIVKASSIALGAAVYVGVTEK
jgi:hypothetical protein